MVNFGRLTLCGQCFHSGNALAIIICSLLSRKNLFPACFHPHSIMAINQPQKSRTVRARDKNPPKLDKPRAKPGPKAKNAFADGDAGVDQILDYIRKQDEDSDDDKEAPEPEFNFSKKDAMAAVDLIQKIVRHRPDLEVALPLGGYLHKCRAAMGQEVEDAKVQTNIMSFFK
ncbi:hypothetical protein B0H13DRAFT_2446610 [Mycena leptocephala]|nr:hypothetical protein B0H13DRAFT_2446610 [Mycena leptocephala]